ncbi:MAG: alanyl-tRNA editing protein, partial [Betaproteobacteria bacterium]
MTVKLFWTKPYRTICEANVVSADGADIVLDQTVFYAMSGGQESDHGTIGGYAVLKAEKRGEDIVYTLPDDHGLAQGDAVHVEIDWPRRYRLMRLHFAAELVLELVCKAVPGIEKIGAHIAEDKARIDFLYGENISTLFPVVEAEVRRIVTANRAGNVVEPDPSRHVVKADHAGNVIEPDETRRIVGSNGEPMHGNAGGPTGGHLKAGIKAGIIGAAFSGAKSYIQTPDIGEKDPKERAKMLAYSAIDGAMGAYGDIKGAAAAATAETKALAKKVGMVVSAEAGGASSGIQAALDDYVIGPAKGEKEKTDSEKIVDVVEKTGAGTAETYGGNVIGQQYARLSAAVDAEMPTFAKFAEAGTKKLAEIGARSLAGAEVGGEAGVVAGPEGVIGGAALGALGGAALALGGDALLNTDTGKEITGEAVELLDGAKNASYEIGAGAAQTVMDTKQSVDATASTLHRDGHDLVQKGRHDVSRTIHQARDDAGHMADDVRDGDLRALGHDGAALLTNAGKGVKTTMTDLGGGIVKTGKDFVTGAGNALETLRQGASKTRGNAG